MGGDLFSPGAKSDDDGVADRVHQGESVPADAVPVAFPHHRFFRRGVPHGDRQCAG
jgi:hypothetical protein